MEVMDQENEVEEMTIPTGGSDHVRLGELDIAIHKAYTYAGTIRGTVFPCLRYKQGNRKHYLTAAALPEVTLFFAPGVPESEIELSDEPTNRPVNPEHVAEIADYVCGSGQQGSYILGPILGAIDINKTRELKFFPASQSQAVGPITMGYLVVPAGIQFETTDGQHRRDGIEKALKRDRSFVQDSIGICIVEEPEVKQRRIDFADLSRTKPVGTTILSWFDLRDELAALSVDLIAESKFFKGRVDRFKETVKGRNQKLYPQKQILTLCAVAVNERIRYGKDPAEMRAMAATFLDNEEKYETTKSRLVQFFDTFAQSEATLSKLVKDNEAPAPKRKSGREVYDLTHEHLVAQASGLHAIGALCAQVARLQPEDRDAVAEALAKLDWTKGSPFWLGSLMERNKLSSSSSAPHRGASRAMLRLIVEGTIPQSALEQLQLTRESLIDVLHAATSFPEAFEQKELNYLQRRAHELFDEESRFNSLSPTEKELVRTFRQAES